MQNDNYSPTVVEEVYIEGGTFIMGSSHGDEYPKRNVKLKSFYISKAPISCEQWHSVIEGRDIRGLDYDAEYYEDNPDPVSDEMWYSAAMFCNELSEKEGLSPVYAVNRSVNDKTNLNDDNTDHLRWEVTVHWGASGYRLPTEAEWEYASNKALTFEDDLYEWCWDWYGSYNELDKYYPRGIKKGRERVLRCKKSGTPESEYRTTDRFSNTPSLQNSYIEGGKGFRVVRNAKDD